MKKCYSLKYSLFKPGTDVLFNKQHAYDIANIVDTTADGAMQQLVSMFSMLKVKIHEASEEMPFDEKWYEEN